MGSRLWAVVRSARHSTLAAHFRAAAGASVTIWRVEFASPSSFALRLKALSRPFLPAASLRPAARGSQDSSQGAST